MKQIELTLNNAVNVDVLESILKEKFPQKKVTRQNWGRYAPFLWLKMNFWIRVQVVIKHKPKKQKTTVMVSDNPTMTSLLLFGWIPILFRKNHRKNVMAALREGLNEKLHVEYLN